LQDLIVSVWLKRKAATENMPGQCCRVCPRGLMQTKKQCSHLKLHNIHKSCDRESNIGCSESAKLQYYDFSMATIKTTGM